MSRSLSFAYSFAYMVDIMKAHWYTPQIKSWWCSTQSTRYSMSANAGKGKFAHFAKSNKFTFECVACWCAFFFIRTRHTVYNDARNIYARICISGDAGISVWITICRFNEVYIMKYYIFVLDLSEWKNAFVRARAPPYKLFRSYVK